MSGITSVATIALLTLGTSLRAIRRYRHRSSIPAYLSVSTVSTTASRLKTVSAVATAAAIASVSTVCSYGSGLSSHGHVSAISSLRCMTTVASSGCSLTPFFSVASSPSSATIAADICTTHLACKAVTHRFAISSLLRRRCSRMPTRYSINAVYAWIARIAGFARQEGHVGRAFQGKGSSGHHDDDKEQNRWFCIHVREHLRNIELIASFFGGRRFSLRC